MYMITYIQIHNSPFDEVRSKSVWAPVQKVCKQGFVG